MMRRVDHDGHRRRIRFPALAVAFVILSLVVLSVAPALIMARLEDIWTVIQEQIVPASQLTADLRFQVDRQTTAVRGFVLSRDLTFLVEYRDARAVEEQAMTRLDQLARSIGPSVEARLDAADRSIDQLHELNTALLNETVAPEELPATLRQQQTALDTSLDQIAALQSEIGQAAEARARESTAGLARQQALAIGLGVLATLVAAGVGWFARRQDALSAELARSVAEERRLREEAELGRDELERITESRARLMRGFSHDVKNPLGAADGYLQILELGIAGPLTPKQAENVAGARRSIGAALSLIEDLLELARAETGRLTIEAEPVDVREVLEEAVEQYRAQAETKGLSLEIDMPADLPRIISDSARIRQIASNLLSNAVKFTERGGVTVRVESREDAPVPVPGRCIGIHVQDTGPGIPEDQQRLLFHEFTRLTTDRDKRGAGIGLAISRRIARALGGEITVESEVGRGSTFTLWLPERVYEAERPAAA